MSLPLDIQELNIIKQDEIAAISRILFNSFAIVEEKETKLEIDKKEESLNAFYVYLKSLIDNYQRKEEKFLIIKILDRLTLQKELLELTKEKMSFLDVKMAAQRLGRKAQSSFGSAPL